MPREIEVVPYDPQWVSLFQREAPLLAQALGDIVVAVHHAGSTAVPGLYAKPTIDFLIVVRDLEAVNERNARMEALGYEPRGENGISGRRYFQKKAGDKHLCHVHVFEQGHPEIRRMLVFRDYLIAHPDAAQAYGELKRKLAQEFRLDPEGYTHSKDDFIRAIVQDSNNIQG